MSFAIKFLGETVLTLEPGTSHHSLFHRASMTHLMRRMEELSLFVLLASTTDLNTKVQAALFAVAVLQKER